MPQLTEGLLQMIMQNTTNQIGTLSMETLINVLSIDEQFVASVEAKVTPLAIALFLKNTNGRFVCCLLHYLLPVIIKLFLILDPLVNSLITDILRTLINNPYINSKVEQRLLPTLTSILNTTLVPKMDDPNNQKDFANLLTVILFFSLLINIGSS